MWNGGYPTFSLNEMIGIHGAAIYFNTGIVNYMSQQMWDV